MKRQNHEPESAPGKIRQNGNSGRQRSVLEAFEQIVMQAQNTNLAPELFERASRPIGYASRKLKLTPMQTVLLALFVDRSEDSSIRLSEIADYIGCSTTRMLRLSDQIDVLVAQRYLRASYSRSTLSYRVPQEVIRSLRQNQPYCYVKEPIDDTEAFFARFSDWMEEMSNDELTHEELLLLTQEALEEIRDSYFARQLRQFGLSPEDMLLFVFMAHLFVENDDNCIGFHDIENLYNNNKLSILRRRMLRDVSSMLFHHRLIQNTNENGMARPDCFQLTDFAKEEVLSELHLAIRPRTNVCLVRANTFPEKQLIYNPTERKQVQELSTILSADRFADVQRRLRENGMRSGFCCLFYGSPGTGKTETVYQIARSTGRDILCVDVEKIKSCWVGQSEGNMKKYFDRYRSLCREMSLAPILLFNEADAILGLRMEQAQSAVDKMENSIQNIILQEMESLEGIMIATTNLTTNLDKAFERRFLYKIAFERPSVEARARIWQIMLPKLKPHEAYMLASQFDLSGGEIENIIRKHTVQTILSGSRAFDVSSLADLCRQERIHTASRPRIGF